MRVLVVDDEPAAAGRLKRMLSQLGFEDVLIAANGLVALELAGDHQPELVLLDITMPEVDGFDVAVRLPEPKPAIVFQTAHHEHALRAFEVQAVDYLVKPVALPRLKTALDKAARQISARPIEPVGWQSLDELRAAYPFETRYLSRVLVRAARGHRLVPTTEITHLYSEEGLVYAKTRDQAHLTDYTLKELEPRLAWFIRVNRAEMVNLGAVGEIRPAANGAATLVLTDGTEIAVARRRAAEVRTRLGAAMSAE